MSQSREKPKLVAFPPPAHQAIHPITLMHSVPEYTEEERGQWRCEERKERRVIFSPFFQLNNKEVNASAFSLRVALTHPKCVDSAHQLLVGSRNFLFDVVIKAWPNSDELRQGRKVVDSL